MNVLAASNVEALVQQFHVQVFVVDHDLFVRNLGVAVNIISELLRSDVELVEWSAIVVQLFVIELFVAALCAHKSHFLDDFGLFISFLNVGEHERLVVSWARDDNSSAELFPSESLVDFVFNLG